MNFLTLSFPKVAMKALPLEQCWYGQEEALEQGNAPGSWSCWAMLALQGFLVGGLAPPPPAAAGLGFLSGEGSFGSALDRGGLERSRFPPRFVSPVWTSSVPAGR